MVKIFKVLASILCFSFLSCQSISNVKDKLLRKVEKFKANPIEGITFDKLYILEGIYETSRDYEIKFPKLEIHRGSDLRKSEDYLIVHNDGKVDMFYAENISLAHQLLNKSSTSSFYGVIYKNKHNLILEAIEAFKMGGGYGTDKNYVKVIDKKIYIQEIGRCSVYVLAE